MIVKAQEDVKKLLKDPWSAEFSGITFNKDKYVVCGYVNSKNSFGAYTGIQPFVSNGHGITVIRGDGMMSDYEFAKLRDATCK